MRTCWTNRTPFQMGLILILIVAVTFLVVIVFIYLMFLTVWYRSESCDHLYRLFGAWKDQDDSLPDKWGPLDKTEAPWDVDVVSQNSTNSSSGTKKRFARFNNMHLPVAALLERLYYDDNDEDIYKCTVVTLSLNWALTTNNCFEYDNDNWSFLLIRSNSDYWSAGGISRKIENVFYYQNLVALRLQINPLVEFLQSTFPKNLIVSDSGQFSYWNFSLSLPLHKRIKYGKLRTVEEVLQENQTNAPVFDSNQNLLGFQNCKFTHDNVGKYRLWLQKLGVFP